MKVWAHTLVKNEERYVWYAVMSVLPYIDKILLWDTGSTDNTYKILEEIKSRFPEKVILKECGDVDPNSFTQIRQEMLQQTKGDWTFILDGDEVWWDDSINEIVEAINIKELETVVTYYYNLVGDIYHYQENEAGMYKIDGVKGHLTIRAMNMKIPGLHIEKPHGTQGFFDEKGVLVQERKEGERVHIEKPGYLHFTNLQRSANRKYDEKVVKRAQKLKYEIGNEFPLDFYYPEVFFRPRPDFVPNPWYTMKKEFKHKAMWQTPLRKVKRRISHGKVGY